MDKLKSLGLYLHESCFIPVNILVTLPWTHSNSSTSILCWGSQSWMKPYRWGLMRGKERARITFPDLLVLLPWMQPRIQLAFWTASSHCWLMSSLSATSTPKPFSVCSWSVHPPVQWYQYNWYWGLTQPRVLVLGLVTPHRFPWAHSSKIWGPSRWPPVLQMWQPHHSAWYYLQIYWGCIWPL